MAVTFEDFSVNVKNACESACETFLFEAGELVSGTAASGSPVASGQLKGSWDYQVGDTEVKVGSPLENAIWNEFGTGEWAVAGGRKGGWWYKDGSGKWWHTFGKHPRHTLQSAFDATKASIVRRAEQIFGNTLGG